MVTLPLSQLLHSCGQQEVDKGVSDIQYFLESHLRHTTSASSLSCAISRIFRSVIIGSLSIHTTKKKCPQKNTFQDVFDLMQCTLHTEADLLRALQSFIAIFWAFFRFQRILQLYAYITGTRIKSKIIPDFNFPDSLASDYTLKLN